MVYTGVGPEHVALRFRAPRDATDYSPKWTEGKIGKAVELAGDYAEATDNAEGLTGFEYLRQKGINILVLWNNWSETLFYDSGSQYALLSSAMIVMSVAYFNQETG